MGQNNKKFKIFSTITIGLLLCSMFFSGCKKEESTVLRVGAMKGPTSIGILYMMAEEESEDKYSYHMATAADELVPMMAKGELDIALLPANVAAVLYQKMQGGIQVIDINTLGVLYFVSGKEQLKNIEDLKGQTIYLTGKGTTPEAALKYIFNKNGFTEEDYILEFKSEPTEVAAILAQNPEAVALLPQPFATVALSQNDRLHLIMDLNEEWQKLHPEGKGMVTGVTVVRSDIMDNNPNAVYQFLADHSLSVSALEDNLEQIAELTAQAGILAKKELAMRAIPNCNIVCITGEEMKAMLSDYLEMLAEFDVKLLGGDVPGEDFYYVNEQ